LRLGRRKERSKGLHCDNFVALCGVLKRQSKPKISFPFLFPLRDGGLGGGDARKMQGNFWVCPRESSSAAEALPAQSGRTWRVKATTHAARATSGVLLEMGSDFLIQ